MVKFGIRYQFCYSETGVGRVEVEVDQDVAEVGRVEAEVDLAEAELDQVVVVVGPLFQNAVLVDRPDVLALVHDQGTLLSNLHQRNLTLPFTLHFRSGSAASKRSRSGSRSRSSRSRSKSRKNSRSSSKSGSPTFKKKRAAILSESEDDDGQPKLKKSRPKITDSDHEGEENEPKQADETAVEAANKLVDSSGDEGVNDRSS